MLNTTPSSFITLADYLMIDLMHNLALLSTKDLKIILEEHFKFLPTEEKLETTGIDCLIEEPRPEEAPQIPLFITDVVLESENLLMNPCLLVTSNIFNQLMDLWQEHCKEIRNFIGDEIYKPFTK